MQPKDKKSIIRSKILRAMSHPTRLFILESLGNLKEQNVSELTALVGSCDTSTISKHLAVLRKVGLVHDRKDGAQVFYRLACPALSPFIGWLNKAAEAKIEKKAEKAAKKSAKKTAKKVAKKKK